MIAILMLAISTQACASETDAPTDDEKENVSSTPAAETAAPRDAASGLATGKRQHMPYRITAANDQPPPPPPEK